MTRALLLVLVALLALPLALADHVYSHGVVVAGRVVDADGRPAPGVLPTLRFEGVEVGGPCFDSGDERSGPHGDYRACRHTHALPMGVRVNVSFGEAAVTVPVDADLRRAAASLRLPGPSPNRDVLGERTFGDDVRVEGRIVRLTGSPTPAEGVTVNATPTGGETATVRFGNATESVVLDEHGDFAVTFPAKGVAGGSASVTLGDVSWTEPVSPVFRRADLLLVIAPHEPDVPVNQVGRDAPLGVLVVVAALGVASVARARRR